ncbi:MAG: N-succinylarginine dihydrolase [Phycisphaerales bacterium]
MPSVEANFDGLIGPTHNYAGLSPGNVPSQSNAGAVSRPKDAALQGLAKMRRVHDLGVVQGVLPPQQRPDFAMLRDLGFTGTDAQVLERASELSPTLTAAAWSASSMWAANAATVSASSHTPDGRVHMTPANLMSHYHRMIEAPTTTRILRAIFADRERFHVHGAMPCHTLFADEGAANHIRFARNHAEAGVELFVYGFDPPRPTPMAPKKYKSRQSRGACETIVRKHGLDRARVVIARQHHEAIDAGVFHNDVISTGNENVFLYHELAFADTAGVLDQLRLALDPTPLIEIPATREDFTLDEAVSSYVFNSQLLTLEGGEMILLAPGEAERTPRVAAWIEGLVADDANPIARAEFIDVRESMRNGGGPACLRLRVPLTEAELAAVNPGVLLTPDLHDRLTAWVEAHYPDQISPADLADAQLARRCLDGLDELTRILGLGDIYAFQRA